MIVGAGPMQIPAISIAREMGLTTLVTDYNAEAPGMSLADLAEVMSTKDIEGTVRVSRQYRHRLRGVMTVGTDASVTVAAVAGSLGLPGIHFEAAENATHKLKMRKALKAAGVPVPDFGSAWTIEEAQLIANRIGFPAVVKPVDNMGARGVMKVSGPADVEKAFRNAKASSTSGEVLIEAFMDGPELSIDALIYNGEIVCTGVADRDIGLAPYFIELGHSLPSTQPEHRIGEALSVMASAIRALEITHGAAKGDIKLTASGPMVGECAARLSGGWMSSHTFPLATGYSMIRGAIEIALGDRPRVPEFTRRFAVERAIIAQPGTVVRIEGGARARAIHGVADVIIKVKAGDIVDRPQSNLDKQAHVITAADTFDEAMTIAVRAMEAISIETRKDRALTLREIDTRARGLFGKLCRACRVCDGIYCAGQVPGMGGIGTGISFTNNLTALGEYRLIQKVIHSVKRPDLRTEFLGLRLEFPAVAAPVTGAVTNMGGAITEEQYADAVVSASALAGTIAFVGDGATPGKYRIGLEAALRQRGLAIPIFKPRAHDEVIERVRAARAVGCPAVGMDIDGAAFVTMRARGQSISAKSAEELKAIIDECDVPFVVKGVMNASDAEAAVRAGARAIIVSNHGGRVMDHMPGAASVLPEIVRAVGKDVAIVLDGGIRSGEDILKGLALGADLCMIGRPVAIAAVGGGADGVELYWREIRDQIERVMILTGTQSVGGAGPAMLVREGATR